MNANPTIHIIFSRRTHTSLSLIHILKGLGVIVCGQGEFLFLLNQKKHLAKAGESLFIPEDGEFQILEESRDLEIQMLFYQIDPIRDIMGNLVVSMYMYSRLTRCV